jgi:hypothetical protein
MSKCQQCRDNDIELLTTWERFKNWLFYKLFPEDIADLSQNKFTQGFGDGLRQGRIVERESIRKVLKEFYNVEI